jgi:hypothetical protein
VNASGGVQHPSYQFKIQGEGDIVLADLTIRTSGLLLNEDLEGAFTVFDEKKNLVADLKKEKGQQFIVALNPGKYKIVESSGSAKSSATVPVSTNRIREVGLRDFKVFTPKPVFQKGVKPVFLRGGILVNGGFELLRLNCLYNDLEKRFSKFKYFNITPEFEESFGALSYGISAQGVLAKKVMGVFGVKYFSISHAAEYKGCRL